MGESTFEPIEIFAVEPMDNTSNILITIFKLNQIVLKRRKVTSTNRTRDG